MQGVPKSFTDEKTIMGAAQFWSKFLNDKQKHEKKDEKKDKKEKKQKPQQQVTKKIQKTQNKVALLYIYTTLSSSRENCLTKELFQFGNTC